MTCSAAVSISIRAAFAGIGWPTPISLFVSSKSTKRKVSDSGKQLPQFAFTATVIPMVIALAAVLTAGGTDGVRGTFGTLISNITGTVRSVSENLPSANAADSGTGAPSEDPDTLTVAAPSSMNGYARARFGQPWTDTADVAGGHNGCDTRNDILARDLTGVRTSNGCKVLSGTLVDPYTGKVISFIRGKDTSALVQIDHLVALGNAWVSGASSWPLPKMKMIANDPLNLMAVDGSSNMSKSDRAADEWLPANASFRCTYVKRQVMVKNKYQLTVTAAEKTVMDAYRGRC